jgi:hypothetical protein
MEADARISHQAYEEIERDPRSTDARLYNELVPACAGTSKQILFGNQAGAPCVSLAPVPIGQDTPVPPSPQ